MIRKKLYILIAAIISSLIITYTIAISVSHKYEKMVTEKTISAIYDTVGLSSTRRIDFMLDILSRDLRGRTEAEQTGIIKKLFTPYKLFKFDKFTQIVTNDEGKPLHIISTDIPDLSMDMQNRSYREFITRYHKIKKQGGGYEFYSHDGDDSPDRMIYVSRINGTKLWHCADINLKDSIRAIENVFTPLAEMNIMQQRIMHIITALVFFFIVSVSVYIGKQISQLEKERNQQSRNLQKANTLLEIEVDIRKQIEEDLKDANRELKLISSRDGLTGIANRRYYEEYIATEWERMTREKKPLTLLLCDIDFFKKYNDAYGHLEGDECLKIIAETIKRECRRPADLAVRYGGEEFAVILPDTGTGGGRLVAEAIRSGVEKLNLEHYDSPRGIVTVSIGSATTVPVYGDSYKSLFREADTLLYRAKQNGRNRVEAS